MSWSIKKTIVVLPVIVLALFYLKAKYHSISQISRVKDFGALTLTFFLLFLIIFIDVARRKEMESLKAFILCTFYVYVFAVLILTGYFDLFRKISEHGWLHNLVQRVDRSENINLIPFNTIKIYRFSQKQIWGNLLMLMPLGFYIPMLRKTRVNYLRVFLTAVAVSTSIELLQLLTNFRSSDVDDIIMNTTGAVLGFFIFNILSSPYFAKERKSAILSL
ncbi:MAG: hypothetical protein C5B52_18325 [Bacteroidetes bacterium]|nr:MAG: hypothetical protein C5B52_18325 [Bacteroidota bacterium]